MLLHLIFFVIVVNFMFVRIAVITNISDINICRSQKGICYSFSNRLDSYKQLNVVNVVNVMICLDWTIRTIGGLFVPKKSTLAEFPPPNRAEIC